MKHVFRLLGVVMIVASTASAAEPLRRPWSTRDVQLLSDRVSIRLHRLALDFELHGAGSMDEWQVADDFRDFDRDFRYYRDDLRLAPGAFDGSAASLDGVVLSYEAARRDLCRTSPDFTLLREFERLQRDLYELTRFYPYARMRQPWLGAPCQL